jgi:protein O-GlcNAc transferase
MKHQRNHATSDLESALEHHRAGRLQQAEALYKKMPRNADALHLRGVIAHQLNRHEEAIDLIGQAIHLQPSEVTYYASIEPAYRALGKLDDVVVCYQKLLALTPHNAAVHNNLGNALKDQGRLDDAVACYRQALALAPDLFETHYNLGGVLQNQGKLDEAAESYQKAISLKPEFAGTHNNLGIVFAELGRLDDAIACYRQTILLAPDFAMAHNNLGNAFKEQGKLNEAIDCYRRALAIQPDFAEVHNNMGNALKDQSKLDDAIACYRMALAHQPGHKDARNNLGNTLKDQGKLDDAMACYQQTVALNPNDAIAHYNLGDEFRARGILDKAVNCYLKAIALKLDYVDAYNNLGIAFNDQGKVKEAVECYQTALVLKQDFAPAHNNLGNVFTNQGKLDDAIAYYRTALTLKPDFSEAHNNLGRIYHDQGRPDKAIPCYRQALTYNPAFPDAHHNLLLTMQYSSDYMPEELLSEHIRFAQQFEAPLKPHWTPHANARDPRKRLKIGYVSPDFRKHAVAYFIEPVLANHDKSAVEVFCYYNNKHIDAVTQRLQALADHWIPCKLLSDDQLAERIRADGIDILIDLAGHTGGNRLLTFARKPAPVQVTFLGYPATTGLSAIDYRLTDAHVEPPGMTEALNVEQLWRLPGMYCCYRAHANSPDVIDHPPSDDNGYVTFGCFNNFSKVTDPVLALWARVLQQASGARLMLEIPGIDHPPYRTEVERRFARLGVPLERVIFIPRKPENQYVLYNRIDIALDPFPCNGGTTSLDTVWMGVPFVTLAGRHFTSRMGVTILTNAGLPELIAQSEDEYVGIAAALAQDPIRLKTIRAGLRERVQASPLMDAPRLTAHLEQAYRGMWQAWCTTAVATR